MSTRNLASALAIFLVCGCTYYPLRERVDDVVCKPTIMDLAPDSAAAKRTATDKTDWETKLKKSGGGGAVADVDFEVIQTAGQKKDDQPELKPLLTPRIFAEMDKKNIPGGMVELPKLPKYERDNPEPYRKAAKAVADRLFPRLPTLAKEFEPRPGPDGKPLTLSDLQRLAREHSPLLRAAVANVEAAKGAAIQAGMYPNPTLTISGNTQGPGGGPVMGPMLNQEIVTWGKRKLAQAAAEKDLSMAELALRRAETDLSYNIRSQYFAVLVAQESILVNRALVQLTDEVYNVFTDQFKAGTVTPYEPAQMGVFAEQARASLIVARNSYAESWKILATSMGLAGMPPTAVVGRITGPLRIKVPHYNYHDVLAHVLKNHTDAKTAEENIAKARYNLRLAEVTPIPDPTVGIGGWYDNTQGNGNDRFVAAMSLGFNLPVWDQNKGAIRQAQGQLLQMVEEPHRVRNALTASMADAFRRYDENKRLVEMYEKTIMPKQVTAFIATLKRHDYGGEGEAVFWDVINAEQSLLTVMGNYLPLLGNLWLAVADVANLQQTNDIYQLSEALEPVSMFDLEKMIECCHPCGSARGIDMKGVDLNWHYSATDIMAPAKNQPSETTPSDNNKNPEHSSIILLPMNLPQQLEFGAPVQNDELSQTQGDRIQVFPLAGKQ
jgi:cobalt-zinc-cadmium efflux system outer membrane protein